MNHACILSSLTLKSQHCLQKDVADLFLSIKTVELAVGHVLLLRSWIQGIVHLHHCPSCLALWSMLCCFFVEYSDVDQETALAAAHGFTGCLSAVQFSHIAPLKAALQPGRPAPVTVTGHVTESSCVAPAGTDATSRERTHSFAGDLRPSPSSMIDGLVQSGHFPSLVVILKMASGNGFCFLFRSLLHPSFSGVLISSRLQLTSLKFRTIGTPTFISVILFWFETWILPHFLWLVGWTTLSLFCAFAVDHSGTMDDREPLTHAIKSDSAVIGGSWEA